MEQAKYFSMESWRSLVEEKIVPVNNYANAFLEFWKFLKSFDGNFISEVLKSHPELEAVFMGGTKPPFRNEKREGYEEGSFALAINKIFGASVVNLHAYYSLEMQGFEPATIPVKVEKTATLKFIEEIKQIVSEIIRISEEKGLLQEEKRTIKEDEYVRKPEKVFEGLCDFLQLCLNVTAGVDLLVTFAWNIRKITRKYLNAAIPDTKKEENMRFLSEILGLEEYFIPDVEIEDMKKNYTIYAYPNYVTEYLICHEHRRVHCEPSYWVNVHLLVNGIIGYYDFELENNDILSEYKKLQALGNSTIGGLLCRLNEVIWALFGSYFSRGELFYVLTDAPDLKKEYLTKCESELTTPRLLGQRSISWDFVRDRFLLSSRKSGAQYEVSGARITKDHRIFIERRRRMNVNYENVNHYDYELNEPFLFFIDEIMPAVFLGLYDIIFSKDQRNFVIIKRKEEI